MTVNRLFRLILALVAVVSLSNFGDAADLDLELARAEAIVTTAGNRTFRGVLDGFRDGRLFLRRATDGGEVGYSFSREELLRLELPGADLEAQAADLIDRGAVVDAIPLLEAIGRQRLRYLPVLTPAQVQPLWTVTQLGAVHGDPHTALGFIRALQPLAETDEQRTLLLEAELHVFQRLGHADEVRALATRWCASADPAGGSALGWSILARNSFEQGSDDRALWTALQPISFSSFLPTAHLDSCFAVAIAAADRQGDVVLAAGLFREMRARGLAWPADETFAALGAHYRSLESIEATSRRSFAAAAVTGASPSQPPPSDAGASIDSVRKLVVADPPP